MLFPIWDHHSLVYHVLDISSGDIPNVTLFDNAGQKSREARIWFPGSALVRLTDVRTTASDAVLASGTATKDDNGFARFIAQTNLGGDVEHVVWTDSFSAYRVCAAADGTIWALGHDVSKEASREDFASLRHYSFSTGLIRAFLPRSSYRWPLDTSVEGSFAALECAGNSAVIYSPPNRVLVRVDAGNPGSTDVWKVDASDLNGRPTQGFAITDSGHIYTAMFPDDEHPQTGLFELRLENPATKLLRWSFVSGTAGVLRFGDPERTRGGFHTLFGTEGRDLVYSRTDTPGVLWSVPLTK